MTKNELLKYYDNRVTFRHPELAYIFERIAMLIAPNVALPPWILLGFSCKGVWSDGDPGDESEDV